MGIATYKLNGCRGLFCKEKSLTMRFLLLIYLKVYYNWSQVTYIMIMAKASHTKGSIPERKAAFFRTLSKRGGGGPNWNPKVFGFFFGFFFGSFY